LFIPSATIESISYSADIIIEKDDIDIEKYLTATQSSQRLFKIFFLGDLCALCGERLCFFHDQAKPSRLEAAIFRNPQCLCSFFSQ
jgi:hypothetical protein